jgi:methylthioribose-1-phosphate isomerase
MNVLIAGIPTPDLISHIVKRYGEGVNLFVAESRPFERDVAREVDAAKAAGYKITLCTDNMVGSLVNEYDIDAVWSLFSNEQEGKFTAINGARMSAILAKEHGIPFVLFPHSSFPQVDKGFFSGRPVTVEGADYIEHELDVVGADLVTEAL